MVLGLRCSVRLCNLSLPRSRCSMWRNQHPFIGQGIEPTVRILCEFQSLSSQQHSSTSDCIFYGFNRDCQITREKSAIIPDGDAAARGCTGGLWVNQEH